MLKYSSEKEWADIHIFYDTYHHKPDSGSATKDKLEYEHKQFVLKDAPNAQLFTKNSFIDQMRKSKKLYWAHTTSNLKNIMEYKQLYASSGCMIGGVYCTPLFPEKNNSFRMHNLGSYIHKHEVKKFLDPGAPSDIQTLIIETEIDDAAKNNIVGVDYLRLGELHYHIYKDLEYLLSEQERAELHNLIIAQIRRSLGFLNLCLQSLKNNTDANSKSIVDEMISNIPNLPILGYIYFESVIEYILLHQDNEQAKKFHKIGELYNPTYKNLIFDICPALSQGESLGSFTPSFQEIVKYIKAKKIFKKFDTEHFKNYLAKKVSYLVVLRLYKDPEKIFSKPTKFDRKELENHFKPLIGHLIYRGLRNFGRYPHFYYYYDQIKALCVWNYWNNINLATPFNGIIPKGEVGLNPAYPHLKYRIYTSKLVTKNGFDYLVIDKEIDLKITPRLVDLKYALMRPGLIMERVRQP